MIRVGIVGRGVVGLSCGIVLARSGCAVTAVGRPPGDGPGPVSAVAAAFWFPYLTETDPASGFSEADLAGPTLEHFHRLLSEPAARVELVDGVEYVGAPVGELHRRWWHDRPEVQFRALATSALPRVPEFGELTAGCSFRVPVVEMEPYLEYLADQFRRAGGRERFALVHAFDELTDFDVIVNCAGLGACALASDASVTGIRGQVVCARDVSYPEKRLYFIDQGEQFQTRPVYIVPRGSDVVLGGTVEPVELAASGAEAAHRPSEATTRDIIRRCALLRPEFVRTRDFTAKVGLRPGRNPLRLGWDAGAGRTPIVHCYGHGGAGVTLSWGSALAVRALIASRLALADEHWV